MRKIRAGADAHPDRLVGEAFRAGAVWQNSNAPGRLGRNLLEGLIVLDDLFQHGIAAWCPSQPLCVW
ncbi:hypothetical protein [Nonomuraea sp. NPDC001699]